ncbi:MAG: twin-arginine translocase TatA/TatE family subunit [Gemmatimonadales bacterium]
MNFGNLGFTEILILLLILVLFFGAKRIPEIGASIGKGIREFKNSLRDGGDDEPIESPRPGAEAMPPARDEPKRLSD